MIIDLPATGLHDVDVFLSHRLANLYTSLADTELAEQDLRWWNSKVGAYRFCELWVGRAREDDHIANHLDVGLSKAQAERRIVVGRVY